MTIYFAKKNNKTALFLTNIHANFEESIQFLPRIEYQRQLTIQNDPVSNQHIQVINSNQPNDFIRIEKRDIQLANQDRQMLYHLLATVLNTLNQKA